tara:strand:+ start:745 stop:1494 length:750 start_codon:yes stop_codon:yes gene_type:complete
MNFKNIKILCNLNGIHLIKKDKVKSTMEIAKNNSVSNKKMVLAISKSQTEGRGRSGSKWISNKGNIFFTLKVYPNNKFNLLHEIGIIISLQIHQTIEKYITDKVKLKWPNDIFIDNKKVGGIIIENNLEKNNNYCLIGVGLNFISSPNMHNYETTFLRRYNKYIKYEFFLEKLIKNIIVNYNLWLINNDNIFLTQYKNNLMYLNKKIKVKLHNNKIMKGKFIDITKEGYLILFSNNKKNIIISGSIFLI